MLGIAVIVSIAALVAWGVIADLLAAEKMARLRDSNTRIEARQIEIVELLAPPRPIKPATRRKKK